MPFKRLPGESNWPYFNDHVERLLFPPPGNPGGRWLCCPNNLHLDFVADAGRPGRRARVDLLERLTTPLDPGCTFGLIHLSLVPTRAADAPDTLAWAEAVSSPFRRHFDEAELALEQGGETIKLDHQRPIRALVERLFGDPSADLERSLYTIAMAQYPPGYEGGPTGRKEWWRALATRRPLETARDADETEERNEETRKLEAIERAEETEAMVQRAVRMGHTSALLLRRHATFMVGTRITGVPARNLRSYWAESIVFCLLQQDCLEEFQRRLAEIGNPLNPEVEKLHLQWLNFRNVLWWYQLAGDSEIPQKLVDRLRTELGTERLFDDLEGDLATYSERQHQVSEDEQAKALDNLQIYGSAIVVLGPLTTAIGLIGASQTMAWVLLAASLLLAVGVAYLVRGLLRRG